MLQAPRTRSSNLRDQCLLCDGPQVTQCDVWCQSDLEQPLNKALTKVQSLTELCKQKLLLILYKLFNFYKNII